MQCETAHVLQLFFVLARPADPSLDAPAFAFFAGFAALGALVYNHGHVLLWHALTHVHIVCARHAALPFTALLQQFGAQILLTAATGSHSLCCRATDGMQRGLW